ncbi:LIM and calponin homology domains-containing protein 1-like isoform X6 [Coregonus clupeaformis]|uniref:LIM and calponin homology domains-containing protein 1-like isoform X6 n=1 Tax=Coregonus clupeaformis TaxID=59861 RepID=UPI001E1C48D7|nr:LIM and calponin homology domains-containing protein 1-like isoform X6 [Coregonus clupeaformis]
MASPTADRGQPHQRHPLSESASEPAFLEAQKWIEAVTGRCFSAKDSRGGLENGILLCELLSSIKPGLVKKINRLPTPIAGLDNLSVFLRGCEELGLKGSQLFDPGDLQDTSTCPNANRVADCSRKLKNVLITIYWLGRAANSCTSYNGPTLDLKEFEGLLSQMRKEAEDTESPQRSIRDSGYIDCWDSERSDSLSPPRHGREDSFDSLDSFGSRSRQTPSPDVLVARSIGSDGRGSDSESDAGPHGGRKLPDVRKDDMLARRTSVSELRVMVPFNQYLPNKSNASGYVPTPLRRKRGDREGREEGSGGGGGSRKSWSTATSPIGGDIPFRFSHRAASVSDDPESVSMIDMRCEEDGILPHHSQVRHELMHNQYNMMKEEEDHWQDDLARWKSRRRSVSQDLIKKEEERKMMEKLMTGEGGAISQRRKSIKTYREIVEEKERRENDLREAYRLARTPEEAALVLHRYAQRFTISEAVLERLQLPKLLDRSVSEDPTATTNTRLTLTPTSCSPTPTSPEEDPNGPLKYLRQQSLPAPKFTATVEAQVVGFPQDPSHRPQIRSCKPEPNPSIRAVSPKSVPLLMPKPYSQPKGMQMLVGPRPGKVDDLLRVNGDMGNDEVTTPESEGRTSPLLFYPSPATPTASSDGSDTPPCEATLLPTHSPSPRASPLPAKLAVAQGGTGTAVTSSSVPGESDAQEKGNAQESTPPSRPTSLPSSLQELQSTESLVEAGGRSAAGPLWEEPNTTETAVQPSPATESQQAPKEQTEVCMNATATRQNATVLRPVLSEHATQQAQPMTAQVSEPSLESSQRAEEVAALADPGPVRKKPPCEAPTTELANSASYPPATGNPRLGLRWEFFTPPEGAEQERGKAAVTQVSSPVVAQAKRGDRWSWDPDEERQRQERWQQEQERMLQEKYQHEQEKLKQEWERAQREVEEEERKYHEEERRILEETVAPLTPLSSTLPSPIRGDGPTPMDPQDTVVRSLADWERKQELLERQGGNTECVEWKGQDNDSSSDISTASRDENLKTAVSQNSSQADKLTPSLQNGQRAPPAMAVPQPHNKKQYTEVLLDYTKPSKQAPSRDRRSVSGKKLCSSCGHPLGKGAAMIIETLSLYFHIQCFKCGVCKGQLGDTTMGTDVRIRNGLLNCHQCYIRSRSAGQPTTL